MAPDMFGGVNPTTSAADGLPVVEWWKPTKHARTGPSSKAPKLDKVKSVDN